MSLLARHSDPCHAQGVEGEGDAALDVDPEVSVLADPADLAELAEVVPHAVSPFAVAALETADIGFRVDYPDCVADGEGGNL